MTWLDAHLETVAGVALLVSAGLAASVSPDVHRLVAQAWAWLAAHAGSVWCQALHRDSLVERRGPAVYVRCQQCWRRSAGVTVEARLRRVEGERASARASLRRLHVVRRPR